MQSRLFICLFAFALAMAFPALAGTPNQTKAIVSSEAQCGLAHIIFNWNSNEKVPFTMEKYDKQLILHFASPVALKWKYALSALRDYVREVDTSSDGMTITLSLRKPANIHTYLHYKKNGIDPKENGLELTLVAPTPSKTISKSARKQPKKLLNIIPESTAEAPKKPVLKPSTFTETVTVKNLAALSPAAGAHTTIPPVAAPRPTVAVPSPSAAESHPIDLPKTSEIAKPAAELSAAKSAQEQIILPIKPEEAVALFVKQKKLWIVTPPSSPLTLQTLEEANSQQEHAFTQLHDTRANVFILALPSDLSATVEKGSSDEVHIALVKSPTISPEAVLPQIRGENADHSLVIPAGKTEAMITLRDPENKQELDIFPMPTLGAGITSLHTFAQFSLLPSAQGIIIQKSAENVNISAQKGLITISSPKGLTITAEQSAQIQEAENDAANARIPSVLFPYARWKISDEKELVNTERKYVHDIAYGTPEISNKARLKLLGLYLSEGLFTEARGMAKDILRISYQLFKNNNVAAVRGAGNFFEYRVNEAEKDFSAPELMNNAEAGMWRTLCKEILGESKETFNFLANYDHIIRYYPPVIIQKLAIIAADRSINRKDYTTANSILGILKRDNLDEPVKKYVDFIHAQILLETKEEEEAARIWTQQSADLDDPLIRARAEFSLINMLLRQDKISSQDAEKRLERLRIVWRDDGLELSVLTLLGNLYASDKQYSKALYTFRDIVLYFPDLPDAVTTTSKMEDIFVSLFNKGGADSMPPLSALSLFYEFRDLVPIGKVGDEMIRNLADRLVNIDLLDRATLLLNHQVQKRLQGEERSRVGTRLALIYLLNHKPREAMDTLKTTGYGNLPPELQLTRLRLTAQALAEQGQAQKAIDVLGNDTSQEGAIQRLSIYWGNKDWSNVVAIAEEILANRNDPSAALTLPESDVLLKLATAYVYEHDTGQIQYLRDYFTPLLKGNPNKDSFLFITSESGSIDYKSLSNLDQDINAVKSFLDNYRDKVKKNGLSSAVN